MARGPAGFASTYCGHGGLPGLPAELICTPLAAAAFRHRARVYGLGACWVRQHILWPWRPAGGCNAAVTGTSCKDDEKTIELVV